MKKLERHLIWLYLVRLTHGKVFESHFESKLAFQKIQILVRSSHTPILRVFLEFSNLSKTLQIIFFGQILTLVNVYQHRQQFESDFEKIWEISIFDPFLHMVLGGGVKKIFFSDFFEITLELFSVLKYINQRSNLTEKNYLWCFRQVGNFKKYT